MILAPAIGAPEESFIMPEMLPVVPQRAGATHMMAAINTPHTNCLGVERRKTGWSVFISILPTCENAAKAIFWNGRPSFPRMGHTERHSESRLDDQSATLGRKAEIGANVPGRVVSEPDVSARKNLMNLIPDYGQTTDGTPGAIVFKTRRK